MGRVPYSYVRRDTPGSRDCLARSSETSELSHIPATEGKWGNEQRQSYEGISAGDIGRPATAAS